MEKRRRGKMLLHLERRALGTPRWSGCSAQHRGEKAAEGNLCLLPRAGTRVTIHF